MKEVPNLEYVEELSGGNETFRQKFIGILKTEFPLEMAEYSVSMGQNQFKEASDLVHKIKHKFNILGLHESYRLAVRHENELREGAHELNRSFMSILEDVEQYLKTI